MRSKRRRRRRRGRRRMKVRLREMAEGPISQRGGSRRKWWSDSFGCGTMQMIGSGVKDNGASPDGFELLDNERMSQKPLCLGTDGDFEAGDPGYARSNSPHRPLSRPFPLSRSRCRSRSRSCYCSCPGDRNGGGLALERIKIIGEGVNELAGGEFLEQLDGE
jgi:hypothetical protein